VRNRKELKLQELGKTEAYLIKWNSERTKAVIEPRLSINGS
jgi:hypothetical protein